jgi:transcriptional/translational regulatory protein YebC/TACO1
MSGHSRWSQIKRKKGKTDVQRGKLFSKILREITVAARNGGGDAKVNMRLKAAMESAKEANMPHENSNRTAPEIRHTFEKHGGNMGASGAVAWMFDRKGVIQVDAAKVAEDDVLAQALDAGATDMRRVEKTFEITTAPAEMDAVRTALEAARIPVLEGEVTFVPQSTVRVEGKDAPQVLRLIEALEELDDVQTVYANYDIPDEVIEAITAA